MSAKMNECEVYFGLFGESFDPSVAVNEIPIDWAVTKQKGNPIPQRSSWKCSSGKQTQNYVDVYEMSSALISRLAPYLNDILKIKTRYRLDAVLQVVLTISKDDSQSMPAIGFDSDVLEFANRVGATIDVDTYLS